MGGIRAGDAAIGLLVAALGLVGLIQAAGATDDEIYVFGLSLLGLVYLCLIPYSWIAYQRQASRERGLANGEVVSLRSADLGSTRE